MDSDLLRLGLVNHALALGAPVDQAWALVDDVLAEHSDERDVRTLSEMVAKVALSVAFPSRAFGG